jgi:hypothetical protein
MDNERITDLLRDVSQSLGSPIRPGLSTEIKRRIPERLAPHGVGTINIIVDLRVSRIAAAAAILIGLVVFGGIVESRGGALQMYRDSKLLVRYALAGEDAYKGEALSNLANIRDSLIAQGREVTYYGDNVNRKDEMAILMQWKIDDNKYGVILGDLSAQTVSPTTLIWLQAQMLQERRK